MASHDDAITEHAQASGDGAAEADARHHEEGTEHKRHAEVHGAYTLLHEEVEAIVRQIEALPIPLPRPAESAEQ